MIKLVIDNSDPTLAEADRRLELREAEKPKRSYAGISGIGDCERKNYYRFYGVQSAPFNAKTLKNFRDGHRTEELVIEDLRGVDGLTIVDRDPESGKQIEVSDFEGHFQGHLDFEVLGIKQAPKTWHVGEVKCAWRKADSVQLEHDLLRASPALYGLQGPQASLDCCRVSRGPGLGKLPH